MPPTGGPGAPRQIPDGPPSEQARAALSERLRRELVDARMRFEEAALRAETHQLLGQHDAAADVLQEQEQILADLQARLGRAVSAAVVERDAEQIFADLVATERLGAWSDAAAPPARHPDPRPSRRGRTPALAGVSSLVAVVGLAAAAILGLTRGLDEVDVTEAAADSTPDAVATDDEPLVGPTSVPGVGPRPGSPATDPASVAPSTSTSTSTPTGPTDAASPTTEGGTPDPSPSPTPAPELGTVVQVLIDVVEGLDDPDAPWGDDAGQAPSELDSSVPGIEELVDEVRGIEELVDEVRGDEDGAVTDVQPDGDDGFVPRPTAE